MGNAIIAAYFFTINCGNEAVHHYIFLPESNTDKTPIMVNENGWPPGPLISEVRLLARDALGRDGWCLKAQGHD